MRAMGDQRVTPRVRRVLSVTAGLLLGLCHAPAMALDAGLDGDWSGAVAAGRRHPAMSATATLAQSGASVSGILTLVGAGTTETFAVTGVVHRRLARLAGAATARRLSWKGRWDARRQAWRGRLRIREGRQVTRFRLALERAGAPGVECGEEFFAQVLMPNVLGPICAQCHVAGGAAQSTRLRVVAGDPSATARSAIALVSATDPAQSRLLLKPRGELAHGGGQRVVPGSAEDQALEEWIGLVTACGGGSGTGDLYTDNCASCHGWDARGLDGRPDIRCSRSVHDAVRNGRIGVIGEMPAFPNLDDDDIATIQAFLVGLCPTDSATGADLYAGNCAACHGTDATGTSAAPSVRCATRVVDAVRVGRGAAMPSLPALADAELARIDAHLDQLCTAAGRPGADLYAGNCGTCHGATAGGGRNALGVRGPDIRCQGANDFQEKVRKGDDDMPAFPALDAGDVTAIATWVRGTYCSGD
jgi:mono/diheme cytochrome c family protein